MLHIYKDDLGNELVDNVLYPPLVMIHDFTREVVDLFEIDTEEDGNFYKPKKNALPIKLYLKKRDVWLLERRGNFYSSGHTTLDRNDDA